MVTWKKQKLGLGWDVFSTVNLGIGEILQIPCDHFLLANQQY